MLRTYLLIPNINRASLACPFPYFRTCRLIVRSRDLLTLYVHNRLCHQPTHLLHAGVKPLLALYKYLMHLLHYPLPPASLINPSYCFLLLSCGTFHLFLLSSFFLCSLSSGALFFWVSPCGGLCPGGSHSFNFNSF